MAARSVFALGVFAALTIGGDVLAQPRTDVHRGYRTAPAYDASQRSPYQAAPVLAVTRPRPERPVSGTVSLTELKHEIPGKALKEWERAEKARMKGELDKAVTHLRKAIEIDPEFMAARNNLAAIFITTGASADAIPVLEESVKLDPHNATAAANLAIAYLTEGHLEDAERSARRAADLDRTSKRPLAILGITLVMANQLTDEALEALQRAQEEFPQAELLMARVYAARGEGEKAEAAILSYLESGDPAGVEMAEQWLRTVRAARGGTAVASR